MHIEDPLNEMKHLGGEEQPKQQAPAPPAAEAAQAAPPADAPAGKDEHVRAVEGLMMEAADARAAPGQDAPSQPAS